MLTESLILNTVLHTFLERIARCILNTINSQVAHFNLYKVANF